MLKKTSLLTVGIITAMYAATLTAQSLYQTPSSKPNPNAPQAPQKILSPAEFSNQATQMDQRGQMKYQQQLDQNLSRIPQPTAQPSSATPTQSTPTGPQQQNMLPNAPATNAPAARAPTTPTPTTPSVTPPSSPPAYQQQPRQPQPAPYTGFQGQGGSSGGQSSGGGQQQNSGGWNIKY